MIARRNRQVGWAVLVVMAAGGLSAARAGEVRLARHPDYHAGKVVFSYLGDIWLVNEDGSNPRRLTVNPARDEHPRFSPDGHWIAFSSNRYGNLDVFVMPAEGGEAKRLTFHSASDTVVGWSRDSKRIIFSSARGRVFPGIPSLYEVSIDGTVEEPLPADWGYWGSYSPDGTKFAFNRHPMVWWRRHYRGSYAADLWVMDIGAKTFRQIIDRETPAERRANDFWPMYGANGEIYFVSDRATDAKAGSPEVMKSVNNIWKVREDGSGLTQVTHHTSDTLFWPSLSADGKVIAYEEDAGLWLLDTASGQSRQVKVTVAADAADNAKETLTVNGEADGFDLSPSTKRAVISTHGELFTIATDKGDVRRVMGTPGARETDPQWSPDGKRIAFVSDRSGREEVWACDERGENLKQVSDSDSQKGQIAWSPDSQALLYAGSDRKLHRYDFKTEKTTELASGDVVTFGGSAIQQPRWSPDGKWVAYTKGSRTLLPHVYIVPADGGQERRVTDEDSYSDAAALWTPDGKRLVYLSGLDISNIGPAGRASAQIFVVSLAREEKDPFDKSIDSEAEATAAERERDKDKPKPGEGGRDGAAREKKKVEVKIDWNKLSRRARQLTRTADTITGMAVSPDSKSIVFSTLGTEGGRPVQTLWSLALDGERPTRIAQGGRAPDDEGGPGGFRGPPGFTSLQYSKDGKTVFYQEGKGIYSVAVPAAPPGDSSSGTPSGSPGSGGRGGAAASGAPATGQRLSFAARVDVDRRAEHKQVFDEAWRVMKHRFYDPKMHGVNWDEARKKYEPLLDHAADQEELQNVILEMIGELNASHTGVSGGGREAHPSAETRFPGFELEPDASGFYKVAHVYRHGPADKDSVRIGVGDFVLAVDGQDLKAGDNYWRHYIDAPGGRMEFVVNSKPSKDGAWTVKVTPVSSLQHATLQYDKWVRERKQLVDKLGGGEIGYLHIRQMNEPSLRKFERDLAEQHHKKALVIDQRFNPGGNIDQELLEILQQKQYQYTRLRDSVDVRRPLKAFFGPMVVMQNERSTSDAEVFPDGFRTLGLGKLVGVTTYGAVIGTGAYPLMDGSTIRTPGSGLWNVRGVNLENYGVPPDVSVDNTPEDFLKGRDAQLEKAVEVLKAELAGKK